MKITCCGCGGKKVDARLTDGIEIYPHREDLYDLPFWKCDDCGNFVGCHHKTSNRTKPLGCIATKEVKAKRIGIHQIIDPLWQSGKHKRNCRSLEEVAQVKALLSKFIKEHDH